MELRHLEYFVAVAEELSFTRAAARLHVVQSGVSATIRALEQHLRAELFERGPQRIALTDAGTALLPEARAALDAAQGARDAVAQVRGGLRGTVNVGAMTSVTILDLPGLLGRFTADHPGVTVRLRAAPSGSAGLAQSLLDGEFDLAFLSDIDRPHTGLDIHPLARVRMAAIVPDDPRLVGPLGRRLGKALHRWRYEDAADPLPEGDISGSGAFSPGQEPTLRLTMDHWTPLYLRGYVAGEYTGTGWQQLAARRLTEEAPMLYSLQSGYFFPAQQLAKANGEAESENHVTIQVLGACRSVAYTPYGGGDGLESALNGASQYAVVTRDYTGSLKKHVETEKAADILMKYRKPETPVGIVRNAGRKDEASCITTLGELKNADIDMFSVVIVGNSQTYTKNGRMITPRGYRV